MLFLMKNKKLTRVDRIKTPIYKFETGVEFIRVLIPNIHNGVDMSGLKCVLQILTPNTTLDENGEIQKVGKYKFCNYDSSVYKENYLTITIPITSAITEYPGEYKMWLLFISGEQSDASDSIQVLKTNNAIFEVVDNGSLDSYSKESFDEIWEHTTVDELQKNVVALTTEVQTKADAIEIVNNEIVLKSGETVLNTVQLTDDVAWEEL